MKMRTKTATAACIGVEDALDDASTSGVADGTPALRYLTSPMYGDDGQAVSIVLCADQPGWCVARTELIDEDDDRWEYVG
jgi:hypothetical protein